MRTWTGAAVTVSCWRARSSPCRRPREPPRFWTVATAALDVVALTSLVIAVVLTFAGGGRLRYGSHVIVSVRQPWRAWLVAALLIGARTVLARREPVNIAWLRALARRTRAFADRARGSSVAFYVMLALVSLWL